MTHPSKGSRFARAGVAAAFLIGLSAGSALAGEVTGRGDDTPIKEFRASSICSFSGLNDREVGEGPVEPRTQNWGTIPKDVRATEPHPGFACNGHHGFLAGGE